MNKQVELVILRKLLVELCLLLSDRCLSLGDLLFELRQLISDRSCSHIMLSAISKRGKLRFMLYKENMDSEKLIDFMGRLIRDAHKKVFLILDNLRVHHSKKVQEWLEKHKDRIEVFYL